LEKHQDKIFSPLEKEEYVMRKLAMLALVIINMGFLTACAQKEEPPASKKPVTEEKVMIETKEAAEAVKAYTEQQREQYQKRITAQINEIQKKIAELSEKAEKAKPEVQAKLKEEMEALQKQAEASRKKLAKLTAASGKAWEDIKAGLDKAMQDLRKSYQDASSHF
jgi:predicted  nucleic acid-binding Zn-ribbon protein